MAKPDRTTKHDFLEFFAGGGMARAGLGPRWRCLFANDFDHKKGRCYEANWGKGVLKTADVKTLTTADIPGPADLAWASFPCQDLSLAGGGAGLKGARSGAFWPFWRLMTGLMHEGRGPALIVLENVCGVLTSHNGQDFAAIAQAFCGVGYRFGALVVDAALFVPQSRPRLFIIGVREGVDIPADLTASEASRPWHTRALRGAFDKLSAPARRNWLWWRLPTPPARALRFADVIEEAPTGVQWHDPAETARLLGMMSAVNLARMQQARQAGRLTVGAIYRRTRVDENGDKTQRAEVRFDDLSGCLRTPVGGSSRQLILVVQGEQVRSRLISSRETARLMGLPDDYILPTAYNEAYHLTGDGVAVPVVRYLAAHVLEPLLAANRTIQAIAA